MSKKKCPQSAIKTANGEQCAGTAKGLYEVYAGVTNWSKNMVLFQIAGFKSSPSFRGVSKLVRLCGIDSSTVGRTKATATQPLKTGSLVAIQRYNFSNSLSSIFLN